MTQLTNTNLAFYNTDVVSVWQGIRALDATNYLMVGTLGADTGILYVGPLDSSSKSIYTVAYPEATSTSVYGPDDAGQGRLQLVGSYKNGTDVVNGFLYQGTTQQLTDSSRYQTISLEGNKFNYLHSVMGHLLVGNCDNPIQYGQYSLPLGPGNAFIYNIKKQTFDFIVFPNSITNTAYGLWYNGDHSYTICGGYANTAISIDTIYADENQPKSIGKGYVVDYDSKSHKFSNWTSFSYPISNSLTHFEGISSDNKGEFYQLIADVENLTTHDSSTAWLQIQRKHKNFKPLTWIPINYPLETTVISGNSVAGLAVVGVVLLDSTPTPYQVKIIAPKL